MGFALAAGVPVVIVADVERGGAIASVLGTWTLLNKAERNLVHGTIINKFRGDTSLFKSALDIITDHTDLDCLGVVPYFPSASLLPDEDSVALDSRPSTSASGKKIHIAVPRLPRIANFDDLDPLDAEPDVQLAIVAPGRPLPVTADIIILPGSKSTLADLATLKDQGWDIDIRAAHRRGTHVLGICAGYQMLGRCVADPNGVEGSAGVSDGLGLLDVETVITGKKILTEVQGTAIVGGAPVSGYEMHMGNTTGPDLVRPMFKFHGLPEGARSAEGHTAGTNVHGLFTSDEFRHSFINFFSAIPMDRLHYAQIVDQTLDHLATHLERHLDLERLLTIARGRTAPYYVSKSKITTIVKSMTQATT